MIHFIDKYGAELKKPVLRWSELHERLGELYAINGDRRNALKAFLVSYINRPSRLAILVKCLLSLLGSNLYRKYRNIS
jgi:hypothetical protein